MLGNGNILTRRTSRIRHGKRIRAGFLFVNVNNSLIDAESLLPTELLLHTYFSIVPAFNAQRITNVLMSYSKLLCLVSLANFIE